MSALFPSPSPLNARFWRHMRIGLMGGTFNPPHAGHLAIAQTALIMLKLDAIWWLVTPLNPLKKKDFVPNVEHRLQLCRSFVRHPRIIVSDLEAKIGSYSTSESIDSFQSVFPAVDFVWVAGYDNALGFHLWEEWRSLPKKVSFCFIARPPACSLTENCSVRLQSDIVHKPIFNAGRWPLTRGYCYYILQMHMVNISSTQIREGLGTEYIAPSEMRP